MVELGLWPRGRGVHAKGAAGTQAHVVATRCVLGAAEAARAGAQQEGRRRGVREKGREEAVLRAYGRA